MLELLVYGQRMLARNATGTPGPFSWGVLYNAVPAQVGLAHVFQAGCGTCWAMRLSSTDWPAQLLHAALLRFDCVAVIQVGCTWHSGQCGLGAQVRLADVLHGGLCGWAILLTEGT